MTPEGNPSLQSPEKPESHGSPFCERWLIRLEFGIVCWITCLVFLITVAAGVWITCGCWHEGMHRLHQTLISVNTHWKISLLLLVPLFYRPVRIFLFRVEKFGGMQAKVEGETNPLPSTEAHSMPRTTPQQ